MTGTLALMPQVSPTGLPYEPHATPRSSISTRPSIKARPSGPRQPRTQDLNDLYLRRASATATCSPSKHSVPTPDILPKPRRHTSRVASAPSSTSASSGDDTPTPVTNDPSSLVMTTTTTTTMTHPSPTPMRASDSTPPFLLQRRHGPPHYLFPRTSISASQSNPSFLPLKQKRSFKISMNVYSSAPQHSVVVPPATEPQTYRKSFDPAPHPITVPVQIPSVTGRPPSASRRSLPVLTPPPEKALPPIPFPSPPLPAIEPPGATESVLLQPPATTGRPVSQDAEETIRQLEQLAAEIKHKSPASPPRSSVSPLRISKGVPRKPKATVDKATVSSGRSSKARLSVPRIVVTNPSTDNLASGAPSETLRTKSPDSEDGSGDATEEELWVEQYGGWGTSEKGKWKESSPEEDTGVHDSASSPHTTHNAPSATLANSEEVFYIYEPIGAPEFLAGSSTSPIARATPGFHSHGFRVPSKSPPASVARRRRRPAALVLANPEQADWYGDAPLGSAPPLPRPQPTPPLLQRPVTAPGPASDRSLPALPSELLLPRRAKSSDVVEATTAASSETKPYAAVPDRRSEPLTVAPRATSAYAPRGGRAVGRQATSWASSTPGTTSEPNSPRHGPRPRLKSIKGLFKHFSK
ncbi:hypothetical protein C8Q79DRAFT_921140 [Trametes meyenii]|nr:hypothetical protein C8Q79DRAFT_921140 [Trametes meyenii]